MYCGFAVYSDLNRRCDLERETTWNGRQFNMAKVIPLIHKPKEWLWFGHKCACYEYWLRGDGVIVV